MEQQLRKNPASITRRQCHPGAGVQTSGSARAPRATERERAGVQTSGSAGAPRATERERAGKGPAPRVQREMQSPRKRKTTFFTFPLLLNCLLVSL